MKLKSNQPRATAEQVVKDIRRATRRHYSTEDKIRIVSLMPTSGRPIGTDARPTYLKLQRLGDAHK